MQEPKVIQENETQKGVIYHYWPDGTLRKIPYKDFTEKNIGKYRVYYERLIFITKVIIRLIRHFKSIEVRKETDRLGQGQYITRWKFNGKLNSIDIPVSMRNIRMAKSVRYRHANSKG